MWISSSSRRSPRSAIHYAGSSIHSQHIEQRKKKGDWIRYGKRTDLVCLIIHAILLPFGVVVGGVATRPRRRAAGAVSTAAAAAAGGVGVGGRWATGNERRRAGPRHRHPPGRV